MLPYNNLIIANKELAFQEELNIANKKLAFQNEEKEKRAAELVIANEEKQKQVAMIKGSEFKFTLPIIADYEPDQI